MFLIEYNLKVEAKLPTKICGKKINPKLQIKILIKRFIEFAVSQTNIARYSFNYDQAQIYVTFL